MFGGASDVLASYEYSSRFSSAILGSQVLVQVSVIALDEWQRGLLHDLHINLFRLLCLTTTKTTEKTMTSVSSNVTSGKKRKKKRRKAYLLEEQTMSRSHLLG